MAGDNMEQIIKLVDEITTLERKRTELMEEYNRLGLKKAMKWYLLVSELAKKIKEKAKNLA